MWLPLTNDPLLIYIPSVKSATKPKAKSFRATLERLRSNLGWVIVRVPFDVRKTWGSSRVKIRGEVNGCSFRTTLFPQKSGEHFILVNKQVQSAAGISLGSTAEFHIEPDSAPRVVVVPAEIEKIFRQSKRLRSWFDSLSYSARHEISRWVSDAKTMETQRRRAEQMAERMLETMEAERELPPLIQSALARNPGARQGWQRMTPRQRRGELLAIFYYRTPDSRARRLEKTIELAKQIAERRDEG